MRTLTRRKTHRSVFVPLYLQDLADHIEDLIRAENNDQWPTSERACTRVASRLLKLPIRYHEQKCTKGVAALNMIAIQRSADPTETLCRIIHEMAEEVAHKNFTPIICRMNDDLLPHKVAVLVEDRFRDRMMFEVAAEEYEREKKAAMRHRPEQPREYRYVKDEYADPDF